MTPFRSFPGNVRLDKKKIGDERPEAAQTSDEGKLANLITQCRIEINRSKMQFSMGLPEGAFHRQSRKAEQGQGAKDNQSSRHNSLRQKTDQASSR